MQPPSILILGNHPASGYSMHRFARELAKAYAARGWLVTQRSPTDRLSRRFRSRPIEKLVAYVESLIFFPAQLLADGGARRNIHVADHSNALWLLFLGGRRRTVVTCHDLIAVRAALGELPEHRTRWTGRIYQQLVLRGLRRADTVHTVSDATAVDVARLAGNVRITTVRHPVSVTTPASASRTGPYLLIVSSSGWRKRRERAVEVWKRLRDTSRWPKLRLVVVGADLSEREVGNSAHLAADIVCLSGLSDEELFAAYANATALLQVSKYEGFGWPIVEANAMGTPALCTDDAVFREVAGGAGTFIPEDLEEVDWDAIATHVSSPSARDAAKANAERFTFDAFATGIDEIARSTFGVRNA